MKIIHVPIEKVPTRYTMEWKEVFEKQFTAEKIEYITVEGETPVIPIETGSVLDAYGTNKYKLSQLTKLIDMVADGTIEDDDVIFFADLWFPGIEALFYIRDLSKKEFKIAGIYHAGTWDPYDFTSQNNMRDWGQHVELSWLHGVDTIFVATKFHKNMIVMNSGDFDNAKIFVTGIPFNAKQLQTQYPFESKENIVVFPHRCNEEKHPEKFDKLKKKYPQWRFVKTLEETQTREEYFQLLAKSKVMISFADQETWGFSTLESMALGNYVIVPNGLSYRETVPDKEYRYDKDGEVATMLEAFMAKEELPTYSEIDTIGTDAVSKMIKVLRVQLRATVKRREDDAQAVRDEQLRVEEEKKRKQAEREAKKQAKEEEQKAPQE